MKHFILFLTITLLFIGLANAFSNSLDGSNQSTTFQQNNFASPSGNTYQNKEPQSYQPKNYSGLEHSNTKNLNQQKNNARFNPNCLFGQCIPGGRNANTK